MNRLPPIVLTILLAIPFSLAGDEPLQLHLRKQFESGPSTGRWHSVTTPAQWNPGETAIVICDMWNDHYCIAAARRVAEMAPRMNEVIAKARERGVLIIHCPSGVLDKYEGSPQRALAQAAPRVPMQVESLHWCTMNPLHERPLPVSDEEPCDEPTPRAAVKFFDRQIDTLDIKEGDAITDSAEAFYLMKQRGIRNAIIMGVHTNMCVLGRPFGIRHLTYHGINVALCRDLTDTMYNPQKPPFVSHYSGNDLVFQHIERYWCPTLISGDFLDGKEFRFKADRRKHLVVVIAEDEYRTDESLPKFALDHLGHDFRVTLVHENWLDKNDLPGVEVLRSADVVLCSIRRRTFPAAQLAFFQEHVKAGKPLVGIRTASHAFSLRDQQPPEGLAAWSSFDAEVLGGNYTNHYGNQQETHVRIAKEADEHPILVGVRRDAFRSLGSLYKVSPLAESATPLMLGEVAGAAAEPVAWTNTTKYGGRVFYTSLGHVGDFEVPDFQRLLKNGILWATSITPQAESAAAGCCGK